MEPQRIAFSYGPAGKPYIPAFPGLQFNLSNCGELAVVAATSFDEVGIDIERLRPINDMDQIARHFFAPAEYMKLMELHPSFRTKAFFDCWTRKEAYVKAVGIGLGLPLDSFEVSVGPGEPVRFVAFYGQSEELARWQLEALNPAMEYIGAVAVRAEHCCISCWELPEARQPIGKVRG